MNWLSILWVFRNQKKTCIAIFLHLICLCQSTGIISSDLRLEILWKNFAKQGTGYHSFFELTQSKICGLTNVFL